MKDLTVREYMSEQMDVIKSQHKRILELEKLLDIEKEDNESYQVKIKILSDKNKEYRNNINKISHKNTILKESESLAWKTLQETINGSCKSIREERKSMREVEELRENIYNMKLECNSIYRENMLLSNEVSELSSELSLTTNAMEQAINSLSIDTYA